MWFNDKYHSVIKRFVNPYSFRYFTGQDDIALFELETPLILGSDTNIYPVFLNS